MTKTKPSQDLINLQKAAMALGKSGLSLKEAGINLKQNLFNIKMTRFVENNKEVLVEDYTRQLEL